MRKPSLEISTMVKRIKETTIPESITPRELINAFGFYRRTSGCVRTVNTYLAENGLETFPDYQGTWVDREIVLKLTPIAEHEAKDYMRTFSREDPIKRLDILEEAHREPVCVMESDTLIKAETVMRLHNYSQLPVLNENGLLQSCITWESICFARSKGICTDVVKDYATEKYQIAMVNMPLLEAYELVYKHDYIIVVNEDALPIGIVTIADLTSKFIAWTGPYMLTSEVEQLIRQLCDDKYPKAQVLEKCKKHGLSDILKILQWKKEDAEHQEQIAKIDKILQSAQKPICSLDDLTFGQYLEILKDSTNWNLLNLPNVDKGIFLEQLNKVREIRNDVMHFNMDEEDSANNMETLKETTEFINRNMLLTKK